MNETSKGNWSPAWPAPRVVRMRLLLITGIIFPLSWAVNALLIGNWDLLDNRDAESLRHLIEWTIIWIAAVGAILFASSLPAFGRLARLLDWLLSPRIARRMVIALVWAVTLIVFFYAEEDWRGARLWNKYRQELVSGGAQLDFAAYTPKPVPDEQNFAATPVVKSWFVEINKTISTNSTERFENSWHDLYERVDGRPAQPKENNSRRFTDLVMWGGAFDALRAGQTNLSREPDPGRLDLDSRRAAGPAVLEGLKINAAVLGELRAASQRPLSCYPVVYDLDNPWGILLPHLINVRNACRRLQLRACAELAVGRSDEALADVKLMLYLADSVKDEPFLISFLVRVACVQLAVQPAWEGLAEHAWTEPQLQELEQGFRQFNFVADMQHGLDAERAAGLLTAEMVRKKGMGIFVELLGPGQPTSQGKKFANWAGAFIPHGWFHQEILNYVRLHQIQIEGAIDPANKRILPARMRENTREMEKQWSGGSFAWNFLRHRGIAMMLLPSLARIPVKAAMAQTAVDQAALACALERFRLANGEFPEKLEALAPRFLSQLPADPLTGGACNYHRTGDGQFVLYSVGWNEKDDGGQRGKTLFDEKDGDWVWQYPAK